MSDGKVFSPPLHNLSGGIYRFLKIYEYLMEVFYSRHQEAFEGKLVVNYMQIICSPIPFWWQRTSIKKNETLRCETLTDKPKVHP